MRMALAIPTVPAVVDELHGGLLAPRERSIEDGQRGGAGGCAVQEAAAVAEHLLPLVPARPCAWHVVRAHSGLDGMAHGHTRAMQVPACSSGNRLKRTNLGHMHVQYLDLARWAWHAGRPWASARKPL